MRDGTADQRIDAQDKVDLIGTSQPVFEGNGVRFYIIAGIIGPGFAGDVNDYLSATGSLFVFFLHLVTGCDGIILARIQQCTALDAPVMFFNAPIGKEQIETGNGKRRLGNVYEFDIIASVFTDLVLLVINKVGFDENARFADLGARNSFLLGNAAAGTFSFH